MQCSRHMQIHTHVQRSRRRRKLYILCGIHRYGIVLALDRNGWKRIATQTCQRQKFNNTFRCQRKKEYKLKLNSKFERFTTNTDPCSSQTVAFAINETFRSVKFSSNDAFVCQHLVCALHSIRIQIQSWCCIEMENNFPITFSAGFFHKYFSTPKSTFVSQQSINSLCDA